MKICWDTLEGFVLGKRKGELRKGHYTYIEKDNCANCGESYLMNKYRSTDYCGISCGNIGSNYNHSEETRKKIGRAHKGNKHRLGKKHSVETIKKLSEITSSKTGKLASGWKGGVIKKNIPLYDTYSKQIDWVDETRSVEKNGLKLLEVTCVKCDEWFTPKLMNVWDRIKYLKGQINNEGRFYCSEECKNNCELYNQKKWPRNYKTRKKLKFGGIDVNDLKIWREVVLKRVSYICEYCGEEATISHHIKPKKLEPFFALDPDNGIACCEKCHVEYAHTDECNTWNLARVICK